jgi:hypothetical protein
VHACIYTITVLIGHRRTCREHEAWLRKDKSATACGRMPYLSPPVPALGFELVKPPFHGSLSQLSFLACPVHFWFPTCRSFYSQLLKPWEHARSVVASVAGVRATHRGWFLSIKVSYRAFFLNNIYIQVQPLSRGATKELWHAQSLMISVISPRTQS